MKKNFRSRLSFLGIAGFLALGFLAGCGRRSDQPAGPVAPSVPPPVTSRVPAYPPLDEAGLLTAFRRGAGGGVPEFVRISGVQFEIVENVAPNYLIKGRLTYEMISDTFKGTDSLMVEGNTIDLVEKVKNAGDKIGVEFSQRVMYAQADGAMASPPPTDWRSLGQPMGKWRRAFERSSTKGQEALKQAAAYKDAGDRLERLRSRMNYARKIVNLISDEVLTDAPYNWWLEMRDAVNYLGFPGESQQINGWFEKYQSTDLRPPQRRKMLAALLEKEVIPEARRMAAMYDEIGATQRAAVRFFSE